MTAAGGGRVVLAEEEVERMILDRVNLDRYEAQVIPDLNQRVRELTVALTGLVGANADGRLGVLDEALARARRVLGGEVASGS